VEPIRYTFEVVEPTAPAAQTLLHEYYGEVLARRYGRPVTDTEIATSFAGDSNDGMTPPEGIFVVAYRDDEACGCAGVRSIGAQTGEVKRVYVRPLARRTGLATLLMDRIEDQARVQGMTVLRLDTRRDLHEAREMYRRRGYEETRPYRGSPLAEVWFEKQLSPVAGI
jgi:GNAT superfamily N-acetyltransferase